MSVLNTLLLWFLPLALIPLVLHVLTLYRIKTVELSTFRFLFDSYLRQRRRVKFQEVLMTALRTLAVLGLVLLCARPVLKHWQALFRASGRGKIMLIDCSASMNLRTGGLSSLDRAKAAAASVIARLDPGDALTLVRVASQPETVFRKLNPESKTVQEKIDALQVGPSRANMTAAFVRLLESGVLQENPIVYLFTDCQANGWREAREQGLDQILPAGIRLMVVNVGARDPAPNCALVGAAPSESCVIAGLPVILRPQVANLSKTQPAEALVRLFIDDQEVGRTTLQLKPGETGAGELTYVPAAGGVFRGRFEIPLDAFADDNTFLFALNVSPRARVLLVNGKPSADPFENEALYLRAALRASATGDDGTLIRLLPANDFARSLDVQEIPEAGVQPERLRDAGVAILANCGGLDDRQLEWLRDYVAAGGGLMVFPGEQVDPAQYNRAFFAVPGPQGERLTPIELGQAVGDPGDARQFDRLAALDIEHPILSVFGDTKSKYFATAAFYRRFPLMPATGTGGTRSLADFAAGKPALVESRFHEGSVLVAAFAANTRWGNLPLKPEFVPLVLRMVSRVQRRPDLRVPPVAAPDGTTEISVKGEWAPVKATVTDAGGRATPLVFKRAGQRWAANLDPAREKGYYKIDIKGGDAETPRAASATVAVNIPPEESETAALKEPDLRAMLPKAQVTLVDASSEAQQLYGSVGDEQEIWRPLIFLLFAMIGVEFVLATVRSRADDEAAPRAPAWLESIFPAERVERMRQLAEGWLRAWWRLPVLRRRSDTG